MIIETLVGFSVVIGASFDSRMPAPTEPSSSMQMSVRQKEAALLLLVQRATDCIVRAVAADPRYTNELQPGEISDLIVASISSCVGLVRAMVDAHDRMYGDGTGRAFLIGPYLTVLPAAVVQQVRTRSQAP